MKRKGETFTEFLTASMVFGIMMAGIFEFMANQTQTIANIKDRENLMYHAERFMAFSGDKTREDDNYSCTDEATFIFSKDVNILTVRNNNASMTFSIKP